MIAEAKLMKLLNQNDDAEQQFYKEHCHKGDDGKMSGSAYGGRVFTGKQVGESYSFFPDAEQIEDRLQESRRGI